MNRLEIVKRCWAELECRNLTECPHCWGEVHRDGTCPFQQVRMLAQGNKAPTTAELAVLAARVEQESYSMPYNAQWSDAVLHILIHLQHII